MFQPPPLIAIPEGKKYTTYNYIPPEEQKYYPFSNKGQPKEYDHYLLINRTVNSAINWGALATDIDNNNIGNFTCYIQTSAKSYQTTDGGMCQVFEIINDSNNNAGSIGCPEKTENLKPISFKGFKGEKGKNDFPNVFLFAVKYKGGKLQGETIKFAEIYVGDEIPAGRQLMRINDFGMTKCNKPL